MFNSLKFIKHELNKNSLWSYVAVLFPIIFISMFVPEALAATVDFDQNSIVIEHGGMITINDSTYQNGIPNEQVQVEITSILPSQHAIQVTAFEQGDSGIFTTTWVVYTSSTSPGSNEIEVAVGSTITAIYPPGGGGVSSTATIYAADTDPLNLSTYKQKKRSNLSPVTCVLYHGDTDKDGICNDWEDKDWTHAQGRPTLCPEDPGLCIPKTSSGTIDALWYPGVPGSPSKDIPDIYVESDWMLGHKPNPIAIQNVIDAFKNNLDMNLHVYVDEQTITHEDPLKFPGSKRSPGFDQIKNVWFGTAIERGLSGWSDNGWKIKKSIFHYGFWGHSVSGAPTVSGIAEILGNDLAVTLGGYPDTKMVGSTDQQAGTFMHELGHNISLGHGGSWQDDINCKPNLISVMSYSRQFSDIIFDRELDYSHKVLGTFSGPTMGESIDEPDLSVSPGISPYMPEHSEVDTVYGETGGIAIHIEQTGQSFLWPSASSDLTHIEYSGTTVCSASPLENLPGRNDAAYLQTFGVYLNTSAGWIDGRGGPTEDATVGIVDANTNPDCSSTGLCFERQLILLERGGTIKWFNNDDKPHKITVKSIQSPPSVIFNTNIAANDESEPYLFNHYGEYEYFLNGQPKVKGTVLVQDEGLCPSLKFLESRGITEKIACVGVGEEITIEQVRAMRLLRADLLESDLLQIIDGTSPKKYDQYSDLKQTTPKTDDPIKTQLSIIKSKINEDKESDLAKEMQTLEKSLHLVSNDKIRQIMISELNIVKQSVNAKKIDLLEQKISDKVSMLNVKEEITVKMDEIRELVKQDKIEDVVDRLYKLEEFIHITTLDKETKSLLLHEVNEVRNAYLKVVPEFSTVAFLVLTVGFMSVLVLFSKTKMHHMLK